ncbi:Serine/threonine-protein kinase Nek10 [Nymphon striatum]|nr:Serine/threonine-protein kinase Nek10 [Nymphon striatum]
MLHRMLADTSSFSNVSLLQNLLYSIKVIIDLELFDESQSTLLIQHLVDHLNCNEESIVTSSLNCLAAAPNSKLQQVAAILDSDDEETLGFDEDYPSDELETDSDDNVDNDNDSESDSDNENPADHLPVRPVIGHNLDSGWNKKVLNGTDSVRLAWHIVWCLVQFCQDCELSSSIVDSNGVEVTLSKISSFLGSSGSIDDVNVTIQKYSVYSGILSLLAALADDDIHNLHVVKKTKCIEVICILLQEILRINPLTSDPKLKQSIDNTALCCLRLLRILYSVPLNQTVISNIFSDVIFLPNFLSIGNYNHDLDCYKKFYKSLLDSKFKLDTEVFDNVLLKSTATINIDGMNVIEPLGAGAFGSVFKVWKPSTEQYYALKEITEGHQWLNSLNDVSSIISEVNIMKHKLNHPNVVHYHSAFILTNKVYICMEFIDGLSLQHILNSLKCKGLNMKEKNIMKICIQLLSALRYLHKDKNIVHRDLTPNNIIICKNYNTIITDFGLARHQPLNNGVMTSAVGTILYNCPEVVTGQCYTDKADIWSFGCITYQMCALKPPFFANNILSIARKIVEGQFDLMACSAYSLKLLTIINCCLIVDSRYRPDILGIAELIPDELLRCVNQNMPEEDGEQVDISEDDEDEEVDNSDVDLD